MKYINGIEVQEGDVVFIQHQTNVETGIILKIIQPQTQDAEDWSLPKGGVIIKGSGLFTTQSLENDEDIDFVRRAGALEKQTLIKFSTETDHF